MKKILAGSTALVAAAVVAGQAHAAEPIQIKIGGFMEQWVGYADSDDGNGKIANGKAVDYAPVRQISDTELYFRGSTVLDNGLKVSVVMDKEGDRNSNGTSRSFDDVYIGIKSETLGNLRLGATKGFGSKTYILSPDVGIGQDDSYKWVESKVESIERDNSFDDGQKIYYTTPSFNGLTLGGSYGTVAKLTGSSGAINLSGQEAAEVETTFGLAYSGDFSGVGVKLGAGFIETVDENNSTVGYDDQEEYHASAQVSFAGFKVGGGYTEVENHKREKDREAIAWDIGVSYSFEKYAVSASYTSSEVDHAANDSRTDDYELIMVSGSYDLGAGVKAKVSVFDVDESDAENVRTSENDGFGVVAGFRVDF